MPILHGTLATDPPPTMERASTLGSRRTLRIAGYLAVLYGAFGILAGLAAAGTFLPYRTASTFNPNFAEIFTIIAVAGTIVSAWGVVAGWGLLRHRSWSPRSALAVAATAFGLNALMGAMWPEYWAFVLVVGAAYGLLALLVLVGDGWVRLRWVRPTRT
jgi:hypothetical protein